VKEEAKWEAKIVNRFKWRGWQRIGRIGDGRKRKELGRNSLFEERPVKLGIGGYLRAQIIPAVLLRSLA
jgi:hypothetical protein